MLQISEINIISIDKSEETWMIEGELIIEDELSSAFEASYLPEEDEMEELSLEMEFEDFDMETAKRMIADAANDYDE